MRKFFTLIQHFVCSSPVIGTYSDKKKDRFSILLIPILSLIILGILNKIPFFNFFVCYFFFLCLLYILNKHYVSNKYLDRILSESNITIRLTIPIVIFLLFDFNIIIICLIKLIIIITIRIYFLDKLSLNSIIITFIFCIFSSFVSPVISICSFELFVFRMNPSNNGDNNSNFWIWMRPQNESGLPNLHNRAQQLENTSDKELQKELQEYLKTTEHGTNYNETVPSEPNDFNIAKANNAFNDLQKKAQSFNGRIEIAWRATKLLDKINNDSYINDGLPIHNKFTYNELSVLKYFGKHFHLEKTPGYNGVVQHGPFTNVEPYNMEITQSISSKSIFGKNFETEVYFYRKNIKAKLEAINSKVWKLD